MPNEFQIQDASFQCQSLHTVAAVKYPECTIGDGKVLNIRNLFYSAGYNSATDGAIVIKVFQLAQNPFTVKTMNFSVTTFADGPTEKVDSADFEINDILQPGELELEYSLSKSEAGYYPAELEISFRLASFTP
jgi:hypothetical protein